MDWVNHTLIGFFAGYLITDSLYWGIGYALLSLSIDVISIYYVKVKKDDYVMRNKLHKLSWKNPFVYLIPLHIIPDYFTHTDPAYKTKMLIKKGTRWYAGKWYEYFLPWKWREGMWVQSLSWGIIIFLSILILA